jgi:hypothetical protein
MEEPFGSTVITDQLPRLLLVDFFDIGERRQPVVSVVLYNQVFNVILEGEFSLFA